MRPLTRRQLARLLERVLVAEADEAELLDDDVEQAKHLDELAHRAWVLSTGAVH